MEPELTTKIPLAAAWELANRVLTELAPFCERIKIAGSIRREKPEVKDLEIVCIPKTHRVPGPADLFGPGPDTTEVVPGFIEAVNRYRAIKGRPEGKYTQRVVQEAGIVSAGPFIETPTPEIRL